MVSVAAAGSVDNDIVDECAVEKHSVAKILIDVIGHGRAEVVVCVADVDVRGVVAVDSDDRRRRVRRARLDVELPFPLT